MAREVVLRRIAMKTEYSQKGEVAKAHSLQIYKVIK